MLTATGRASVPGEMTANIWCKDHVLAATRVVYDLGQKDPSTKLVCRPAWLVGECDADYPTFGDVSSNFPAHFKGAQGVYVSPPTQGSAPRDDGEARDPRPYAAAGPVIGKG
jgi:hypothetical protein